MFPFLLCSKLRELSYDQRWFPRGDGSINLHQYLLPTVPFFSSLHYSHSSSMPTMSCSSFSSAPLFSDSTSTIILDNAKTFFCLMLCSISRDLKAAVPMTDFGTCASRATFNPYER